MIKAWILFPCFCRANPVKQAKGHRRSGGEKHIIHPDRPAFVDDLPAPVVVNSEPKLDDVESDVLVEGVEDNLADPAVIPRTVNEQESSKITKLSYGEVCAVS